MVSWGGSPRSRLRQLAVWALSGTLVGCGGGSSSPTTTGASPTPTTTNNVLPVTLNAGPVANQISLNTIFASVTVCVPGDASNCQTIPYVQVDTGSFGLRLLSSAVTLTLPPGHGPSGQPLAECVQYANSSTWGSVRIADVKMAGEQASSVPVQVIGDPAYPKVPSDCTNGGFPSNDTLQSLGANGILGVGGFPQDCGQACTTAGASNPGLYYECSSPANCQVTAASLSEQVQNPVALFPADNNGVILDLPAVSGQAASLSGSLIMGIGTQANNGLSGATVYAVDRSFNLTTVYKGKTLPTSYIDSGTSSLDFTDSGIPACKDYPDSLYCPTTTLNLSATIESSNGAASVIPFTVSNADTLFSANPGASVFSGVAGPSAALDPASGQNGPGTFAWGVPFFFNRRVFTAMDGASTPAGPGPYWAF